MLSPLVNAPLPGRAEHGINVTLRASLFRGGAETDVTDVGMLLGRQAECQDTGHAGSPSHEGQGDAAEAPSLHVWFICLPAGWKAHEHTGRTRRAGARRRAGRLGGLASEPSRQTD